MAWNYKSTSVADMRAAFTTQKLDPIIGRPNLYLLLRALKILCRCSQTTKSALGPLGYLFTGLPPEHYTRFTTVALELPGVTPTLPAVEDGMNSGQREQKTLK